MQIIENIDILELKKIKNLISSKEIIKERSCHKWEKIFAIHITNRKTISIMYKNQ